MFKYRKPSVDAFRIEHKKGYRVIVDCSEPLRRQVESFGKAASDVRQAMDQLSSAQLQRQECVDSRSHGGCRPLEISQLSTSHAKIAFTQNPCKLAEGTESVESLTVELLELLIQLPGPFVSRSHWYAEPLRWRA